MSSALDSWQTTRASELDQVVASHKAIGGSGRGRRYATQQLNYAYATLLSAQFQGFCRDLHSEAAGALVAGAGPPSVALILSSLLTAQRKLDSGNPNAGNIGHDFKSLGIVSPTFWDRVRNAHRRSGQRQEQLETLNTWRNAIAHQDWSKVKSHQDRSEVKSPYLQLKTVTAWRAACDELAKTFELVIVAHLANVLGNRPW